MDAWGVFRQDEQMQDGVGTGAVSGSPGAGCSTVCGLFSTLSRHPVLTSSVIG